MILLRSMNMTKMSMTKTMNDKQDLGILISKLSYFANWKEQLRHKAVKREIANLGVRNAVQMTFGRSKSSLFSALTSC